MRKSILFVSTLAAASAGAAALCGSEAVATTLPETTYFYQVTMTDKQLVVTPKASVKPGSLVVFTIRNKSSKSRNLVFGNFRTGFMVPGAQKKFELNFLVPWSFVGTSVERNGGHALTARFICSW